MPVGQGPRDGIRPRGAETNGDVHNMIEYAASRTTTQRQAAAL